MNAKNSKNVGSTENQIELADKPIYSRVMDYIGSNLF